MEYPADNHAYQPTRRQRVTEHLANERTHLAYVRTSASVISLGIAINRFGIFLVQAGKQERSKWLLLDAEYLGIGLVMFGMLLLIFGVVRYYVAEKAIEQGVYRPHRIMILVMTLLLLLLGSVSLAWLFWR